ncbi:hypothetical protein, partial [Acinetobacter baumannii]|uniref:hypothetical protein n=1 Tax=Acinetobacter baumannii TaxID=470 RepID=UPI002FE1A66B
GVCQNLDIVHIGGGEFLFHRSHCSSTLSVQHTIARSRWQPSQIGPISSVIAQTPILRQACGTYDVRQITAKRNEHHENHPCA